MLLFCVFIFILIILSIKLYQKLTCGICRSSAHMVGKTVIVTGGNSGIGLETAIDLAERGARVIIACRSARRAAEAILHIMEVSGNKDVHYRHLDLASLKSVREFAANILKTEKRLDVLINNAGAGGLGNGVTEDGLHIGMQVNFFGQFLLTLLLLPLLKSSAPSRIVNVSSMMHKYGELDFENLNMEKYWSDYLVYANSKLFLNLMTLECSQRLKNTGVTVNCLHPGVSNTNIFNKIPSVVIKKIVGIILDFIFQTPREAAQTSIYLAVSPDVKEVSGKYFKDCYETRPSALSLNADIAKKLWIESEKLVKYSFPESL